ncbi:MAG: DnaJ domain-containing protein [Armatimonadota bacterium]|nr:DnaJ domain-containing protein [bacterium]
MVVTDDYYQVLGVSRHASREAVKHAYRTRVKSAHPDLNRFDEAAIETTRRIIEAYHTLSDPMLRQRYDLASTHTAAPEISVQEPQASSVFMPFLGAATKIIAYALLVCGIVILTSAILRERPSTFKATLIDQQCDPPPRQATLLVEPRPSDCLEWYRAREYSLTFASGWASSRMVQTYSKAAVIAARHGDRQAFHFYRDSIRRAISPSPVAL